MRKEDKYKPVLSVRISEKSFEKLDKCLELKNKEYEKFGVVYKRSDILEEMISNSYLNAMADSNDPDVSDELDRIILNRLQLILRQMHISDFLELIAQDAQIIKRQVNSLYNAFDVDNQDDYETEEEEDKDENY